MNQQLIERKYHAGIVRNSPAVFRGQLGSIDKRSFLEGVERVERVEGVEGVEGVERVGKGLLGSI